MSWGWRHRHNGRELNLPLFIKQRVEQLRHERWFERAADGSRTYQPAAPEPWRITGIRLFPYVWRTEYEPVRGDLIVHVYGRWLRSEYTFTIVGIVPEGGDDEA